MDKNDRDGVAWDKYLWDVVVAATLLTRLPLPHAPKSAFDRQANSVWAFPIIGLFVAGITCIVGCLSFGLGMPAPITAGLMLGTSMVMTGAMHEDGLADCADGFWGGFDPVRRLEIMKDSQIGTYGVLALIIVNGLRWVALSAVISTGFSGVIAVAILSRGILPILMAWTTHARTTGLSYSVGRPPKQIASVTFGIASIAAFIFIGLSVIGAVFIAILVMLVIVKVAKSKIGGQTGDVIGATQVLTETALLLWLIQ